MKRIFSILCVAALALMMCACGTKKTTVAVVVDEQTYAAIPAAVDAYVKAVTNEGRTGVLVVDKWSHPDSIKAELVKLYNNEALEGAVFVGEIPIPMLRDAQHFATAFKMFQERNWLDSSIPSDRFYDDFDLKFDYIKQDSTNPLAHYYSLRADSAQEINCDIYSARIKAPNKDGNAHQLIEAYLLKAVEAHKNPERMDNILHFAGHGYNSDAMNARIDEASALREQFPFLANYGTKLNFINFTYDTYVRDRITTAMQDETMDLAILHHHGSEDTQYFNGAPIVGNAEQWLELAKNAYRTRIRKAKKQGEKINQIAKSINVPTSWFANVNDKDVVLADSLFAAQKDLTVYDLDGYVSGAKVVIFDACYNGCFLVDDYIAARYIFNPGSTIVTKGNTVNTLQDTWTNELMGLLNLGVSVGDWAKGQLTIEAHLIGDPTFAFAPQKELLGGFDLARAIVTEKNNVSYWRKVLKADVASEAKALAIKMLYKNNAISSSELLEIAKTSPYSHVRLEAFMTNKQIADENLVEAIKIALADNYEITQRMAMITAGKNASPELIPDVVEAFMNPATSARVYFQASGALDGFDSELVVKEMEGLKEKYSRWIDEKEYDALVKRIKDVFQGKLDEYALLKDANADKTDKRYAITGERNGCNPFAVENFYYTIENDSDVKYKLMAAEALGWYKYSYLKPQIIEKCNALVEVVEDAQVKNELVKTVNRLK
ncbi:MAG: hypothetical protein IKY70_06875 [Bacteroidales bacterium]|nr:hypothetical protein [Bacteroidales bacterium]